MPDQLYSAYNGQLKQSTATKDFATSMDPGVVELRYLVLKSARAAFHYAYEYASIMFAYDMPDDLDEFEVSFFIS